MTDIKKTESEKLLKEIESALNYWRLRATHIEYGVKSKPETKIPSTQFTMKYKEFTIKVEIK